MTTPFVLISLLIFIAFQCTNIHAKVNVDPVIEFKKVSGKAFFKKDNPHYIVLFESKESDDYSDHYEEFEFAAKHFGDKVKFVYMNTDVEENWDTIEYLGLIAEDVPTLLFIDLSHGLEKFKAEFSEITRKNIIAFVEDCIDGKSVGFLKSEEVPKGWDSKPLKQLVGKNFDQIIFKQKQTAFIAFYATWCEACQNSMPAIERLAEMFADSKDVLIGRMDATANEIPHMPVLDVPTFALFIKGDTKPIYYTDDRRSAEDFKRFINMKLKEAGLKASQETEDEKEKDEKVVDEKKTKKSDKKEETSKKTKTTKKSKETQKNEEEKVKPKKGTESKTVKDEESKQKKDKKTTATKKTTKEGEEKTKTAKKTTKEDEKKAKTGKETTKEDGEKKQTQKKSTKGKAEGKTKKETKKSKSEQKPGEKDEL